MNSLNIINLNDFSRESLVGIFSPHPIKRWSELFQKAGWPSPLDRKEKKNSFSPQPGSSSPFPYRKVERKNATKLHDTRFYSSCGLKRAIFQWSTGRWPFHAIAHWILKSGCVFFKTWVSLSFFTAVHCFFMWIPLHPAPPQPKWTVL